VLGDGKFPLVLGGEHSITPAILRGVRAVCEEEIVILHFDAHADLREEYGGVRDGHASALRRALEIPKTRLVSCGVRNISEEEVAFFEGSDCIDIFWAREKEKWDRKKLRSLLEGKRIYLTIDVDVFDMSLMPATGTPEPGGLFWEEVLAVIELAAKAGTIIGADITELAPIKGLHGCDFLVAKLAYSILAYAFLRNFAGD
ncbi:MAG: arginase family protein, partial [Parvibaculales bacterium]